MSRQAWWKLLPWRALELAAAAAALIAAAPLAVLPPRTARLVGRGYGAAAAVVWRSARRVARINAHRALGLDRRGADRLARRSFLAMGETLAEGISFALRQRGDGDLSRAAYRVDDPELEAEILSARRPFVFVTAHYGSWEVLHTVLSRLFGERGAAIVRRIDNPFLHRLVVWLRAGARGEQWIEKRGGAREALRRLRQGTSISLLADENAGAKGIFVDFFGRPASTTRTPALLSLMTGAPLLVGVLVRDDRPPGRVLRLRKLDPARYSQDVEGARALTQDFTATLEGWIRERPEAWRWMHWRWRERPDGSSERYRPEDERLEHVPIEDKPTAASADRD